MRTVALLLLSATAASAYLTTGAAPALRRIPTQSRRAVPLLVADDASAVQDDVAAAVSNKMEGVVMPLATLPSTPGGVSKMQGAFFVLGAVLLLSFLKFTATGGAITAQMAYEVTHCTASKAKFFGFVGACCNWFLGLSAVYDATRLGPEVISLPMTLVMLSYSIIFCRWAGWAVMPRNFILAGSHMLNIAAQGNQLRRVLDYKLETGGDAAKKEIAALGAKAAGAIAAVTAYVLAAPALKAAMPAGSYLASSGGPFTIHPWPPLTKFFLSLTSLSNLQMPVEKISLPQYGALTLTGFIFSFYGLFVTPINYVLTGVNILLFSSSAWHLGRKIKACATKGECAVAE